MSSVELLQLQIRKALADYAAQNMLSFTDCAFLESFLYEFDSECEAHELPSNRKG